MAQLDVSRTDLPVTTTPAIMDLEASGFGPGSYPIEVGFILGDGSCFCTLIKPFDDWTHWDDQAEGLHGIRRKILLESGKTPLQVAQLLNEKLHGLTLYSDGWSQDNSWLLQLYDRVGMWPSFTLDTIRKIISEEQVVFWHQAHAKAQKELNIQRHRASSDARLIQRTYELSHDMAASAQKSNEKLNIETVN